MKEKFHWNLTIRSILVAYYAIVMSSGMQFTNWALGVEVNEADIFLAFCLLIFVILCPIKIFLIIRQHRKLRKLETWTF